MWESLKRLSVKLANGWNILHPKRENEEWKMADKKPWVEPELIVVVRSRRGEAVLSACKDSGGGGPLSSNTVCENSCAPCGSSFAS